MVSCKGKSGSLLFSSLGVEEIGGGVELLKLFSEGILLVSYAGLTSFTLSSTVGITAGVGVGGCVVLATIDGDGAEIAALSAAISFFF